MSLKKEKSTIIIGAGVGGLSVATLLVNAGHKVSIYEKAEKVGGRTASIKFKNHILDNGFHIITMLAWSRSPFSASNS